MSEQDPQQQQQQHQDNDDNNNGDSPSTIPMQDVVASSSSPNDDNESKKSAVIVNSNSLPLDWTKQGQCEFGGEDMPIRYPTDVADIDVTEEELLIVGTAGKKITKIGPDFSKQMNPALKQLALRSHLIITMEGLEEFTNLDVLELYDNQVNALQCLHTGINGAPGRSLRVLDISYNAIRDMQPVEYCPNLQELYIANNKVKAIAGLKNLTQLRKIDLGANRIRVMDPDELSGLVHLEELWLGKNKITMIQGLENLVQLRRLDVQSNRLTTIENIAHPEILEELYLAHNGITTEGASMASGLAQDFPNLSVLDLSRNRLNSTAPFAHLKSLDELWISGNEIETFEAVEPIRSLGSKLDTIYLEYNPLQKDEPMYRKIIAEMIPSLTQIDATKIGGLALNGIIPATSPPRKTTKPKKPKDVVNQVLAGAETEAEKARRLQELIIQKAKEETLGENQQ